MLNHTRPQSPLAAHRGPAATPLTHLFAAAVLRRRIARGAVPLAPRAPGAPRLRPA